MWLTVLVLDADSWQILEKSGPVSIVVKIHAAILPVLWGLYRAEINYGLSSRTRGGPAEER